MKNIMQKDRIWTLNLETYHQNNLDNIWINTITK